MIDTDRIVQPYIWQAVGVPVVQGGETMKECKSPKHLSESSTARLCTPQVIKIYSNMVYGVPWNCRPQYYRRRLYDMMEKTASGSMKWIATLALPCSLFPHKMRHDIVQPFIYLILHELVILSRVLYFYWSEVVVKVSFWWSGAKPPWLV